MLSLALARELKNAGLNWQPALNDFFAIPDSDLDDRVFVLSDMMASRALLQGWPAITFYGTAEWALDYIFMQDVVWVPTEEQLRQEIIFALDRSEPETHLSLTLTSNGRYQVAIPVNGRSQTFNGLTAGEAYGRALLHLLQQPAP